MDERAAAPASVPSAPHPRAHDSSRAPRASLTRQLGLGTGVFLRGLTLMLRHPSLRRQGAALGLVSVALLVLALIGAVIAAGPVSRWMFDVDGVLGWLVWLCVLVALLPVAFIVQQLALAIVAGPLRERLVEATEAILSPGRALPGASTPLHRIIGAELRLVGRDLWLLAIVLLIGLLPLIGPPLALIGGALLAARACALELLAAPMELRDHAPPTILTELSRHRALWMLAGGALAVTRLVPLLNILALPACVIGAAVAYHDLEAAGLSLPPMTDTRAASQPPHPPE